VPVPLDETSADEASNSLAGSELATAAVPTIATEELPVPMAVEETSAIEAFIAPAYTPADESVIPEATAFVTIEPGIETATVEDRVAQPAAQKLHEGVHGDLIYKILTALKSRSDKTNENLIVGRVIAR
jgi:hypothetical protein